MMDKILRMERPKTAKEMHDMIKNWNPLTQRWNPKVRSANIPERTHNALRLSRKYRIELEALEPNEETRQDMPIWLHRKANKNAAKLYKTDGAKCLKNKHQTHYMKQLMKLLKATPENH